MTRRGRLGRGSPVFASGRWKEWNSYICKDRLKGIVSSTPVEFTQDFAVLEVNGATQRILNA
jgi:hypothetical protein